MERERDVGSMTETDGIDVEQSERDKAETRLEKEDGDVGCCGGGGCETAVAVAEGAKMLANTLVVLLLLQLLLQLVLKAAVAFVKLVAACVSGDNPIGFSGNSVNNSQAMYE